MANEQKYIIYILGDGNKIRERIEKHLLSGELEALELLSHRLTEAITTIKLLSISTMDAKVVMAGGDDILLLVDRNKYSRELIQQLSDIFKKESGESISFGIGFTIETAYVNLRRAKSSSVSIVEGNVSL